MEATLKHVQKIFFGKKSHSAEKGAPSWPNIFFWLKIFNLISERVHFDQMEILSKKPQVFFTIIEKIHQFHSQDKKIK